MIRDTRSALRPALVLFALLSFITGIAYPGAVLGFARVVFPWKSGGSPIERDGKTIGSAWIAQGFESTRYFHPRPSAVDYNAATSGGSNLGPTNPALLDAMKERVEALRKEDDPILASASAAVADNGPANTLAAPANASASASPSAAEFPPVPVDLVTASGSGLDPEISPAGARFQAARVARARGLPLARVESLVEANTEGRTLGILGEPRVNVLRLNLALDSLKTGE